MKGFPLAIGVSGVIVSGSMFVMGLGAYAGHPINAVVSVSVFIGKEFGIDNGPVVVVTAILVLSILLFFASIGYLVFSLVRIKRVKAG